MTSKTWMILLLCCLLAYAYSILTDLYHGVKPNRKKYVSLTVVFATATLATVLASLQHYIGAPVLGLFFGMAIYNIVPRFGPDFKEGTTFAAKKLLSLGIILVGATLSFTQLMASVRALPLILFNICLSFFVAFLVGRRFLGQSANICTMVGGGTCICGGTAIAALGSVLKAAADEIGYAMTAIFLFDIFSCLLYPYLALAMGLTPEQFSFLAGTAINDTSSVTASAQQFASLAGDEAYAAGAVSIKLVRTTMLIVVVLVVTLITLRTQAKSASEDAGSQSIAGSIRHAFPWFILGFIAMALLNTLGLFSTDLLTAFFKTGSKFLITCALVGVGFKMKFSDLLTKGVKPLLLGGCTWVSVAISSMLFIHLFSGYVNSTGLFA
ncbi:MAG: YeiH family protein [Oscillospiraceae bacterium]